MTGPFFSVPPAKCGAVERIFHALGQEFAKRGHGVLMLASGAEGFPEIETCGGMRIRRGIRLRSTKSIARNLALDAVYALSLLPRIPDADIIVTNAFWIPMLLPSLRRRSRIVVGVHRVPKGQMRLYVRAGVHRLAAVSSAIRRMVVEECPAAERIAKWVPNPIDTDVFVPAPEKRSGETKTIIYTGRIHPEKGLDILIRAFARIADSRPDARLRIVGPWRIDEGGGGGEFVSGLKRLAGSAPVEFAEPLYDRWDLAAALQSADIYCYPSTAAKGEASPVAPLEAMATGLVPVCSDLLQYRDYLEPETNGVIFDHRSENAHLLLARELERLLSDDGLRRRLGGAAARRAKDFSTAKVADMYLADFESLLR